MTERVLNAFVRLLLAFMLSFIMGSTVLAQENISIPQSQPQQKPAPKPKPAISIKLAAEKGGERVYYTTAEWGRIPKEERVKINKIGLVVGQGENAFLLSLFNNMSRGIYTIPVSFQEATHNTAGQLPTKTQMQTIKNNERRIDDALLQFGGQTTSDSYYWCKDGSSFYMGSDRTSFENKALFRIATDCIEDGFKEVIVTKEGNEDYDYYGSDYSEWNKGKGYLRVVGHHGKYGFINEDGKLVIPLKYDSIHGDGYLKNSYNLWDGNGLMAVCINSKWGYINRDGDIVVPIVYDAVNSRCYEPDGRLSGMARVYKEGLFGGVNYKGEVVLPLLFSDLEDLSHSKDLIYAQKENKYGFYDTNYSLVIPLRYDFTSGFGEDSPLCAVKLNEKYGYIDKKGDVIIPLNYEFASPFNNGLAAVVKNGKYGFLNEKGDLVIPIQFDVEYVAWQYNSLCSYKTRLGLHSWNEFIWSPYIAFVKSNKGKYGIINNKGDLLVDYKYTGIKSAGSNGFDVQINGETVYIDLVGNEYSSEKERSANRTATITSLAELGFTDYQNQLADIFKRQKEYQKAYDWYNKAAQNGRIEAMADLGDLFYDKSGLERSYSKALNWYLKYVNEPSAQRKSVVYEKIGLIFYYGGYGVDKYYPTAFEYFSKSSTNVAKYYLGWMYEHSQGVGRDLKKAKDYYKESKGYSDANDRIKNL